MFLDKQTFSTVIKSTPLVSIDLVIKNNRGQALLGQRLNRPAKDYWFVPGGRILKDESLADAFVRLTTEELGQVFTIDQATLLGPFDHFYQDNVFGDEFTTHYVAIAYVLNIGDDLTNLPLDVQHGGYQWFEINDLLKQEKVHKHTKWYFEQEQEQELDARC
ncbi:GDP-mannose mannosyl hydrolase [uncultured Paraglaciecola sp.]|uniref:GDP-mannose mannosyl hydrolase n=1 Tax=uncultured Paraglaciecola sp. TaxID=1765024 RepID=UPI0030DAC0C1